MVRSAYKAAYNVRFGTGKPEQEERRSWEKIWQLEVQPKVRTFLWSSCHGCLPSRQNLTVRGMKINMICPMCNGAEESLSHLLLDCAFSREVWHTCSVSVN